LECYLYLDCFNFFFQFFRVGPKNINA
jgi:hypothetical protein